MSRFFVNNSQITGNRILLTDKTDIYHLKNVLRARIGEQVDVSDKSEWEYKAGIVSISQDGIELCILDKQRFAHEPELKAILYQGIPKNNKLEILTQKCIELGIYRVIPVICSRSISDRQKGSLNKTERLRKIAAEAVKQCRRGIVPEIDDPMGFNEAVASMKTWDAAFFSHENEELCTIKSFLRSLELKPNTLAFMIGPEGGFSDDEATMLVDNGIQAVSLGRTILRTETAAPAALAMVMYELELWD
jgi:16S rRNA (uracil1498-N3)-methyltransferase